jgi:hypothetical protein
MVLVVVVFLSFTYSHALSLSLTHSHTHTHTYTHTHTVRHTAEGDDDMPAHVKSSLFGASLNIPISNGQLALGTWQGVWLCGESSFYYYCCLYVSRSLFLSLALIHSHTHFLTHTHIHPFSLPPSLRAPRHGRLRWRARAEDRSDDPGAGEGEGNRYRERLVIVGERQSGEVGRHSRKVVHGGDDPGAGEGGR